MSKNSAWKNYVKYSSIGFQLVITTAVFFYAGYKLDEFLENDKRIFTLIIGLIGMGIALYVTLKKINS
ncbi:MAG: AtpZ/AtpI family protein [Flavobacteriales bacterium]|nr:AtpZ/AtpI family protein [Flavobacteriales bacterium]